MVKFKAKIYKIGINPVVDPPERVLRAVFEEAGKSRGPIPVRGRLNGAEFVQTLVKYSGAWRLYVNGPMLASSDLKVGDLANVEIEFDPSPRDVSMPIALSKALRRDKVAKAAFDALAPSRRKEIMRYIGALKGGAAIARNVRRALLQLRGGQG